jgi:hypothetical protein
MASNRVMPNSLIIIFVSNVAAKLRRKYLS